MDIPERYARPWAQSVAVLGLLAAALTPGCGGSPSGVVSAAPGLPGQQIPIGPNPGADGASPPPLRNPFEGNAGARAQGRQVFVQMNCYGCHGGHAGGGMGPSLRGPDFIYGGSSAALYSSITQGRSKGMPAWGERLPGEVIWKIVLYIQSLDTPEEPDPPSPAPAQASPGAAPDPLVPVRP